VRPLQERKGRGGGADALMRSSWAVRRRGEGETVPGMFITLWFGFDYGTSPPLGTLII
jgi:hypothetical protein